MISVNVKIFLNKRKRLHRESSDSVDIAGKQKATNPWTGDDFCLDLKTSVLTTAWHRARKTKLNKS